VCIHVDVWIVVCWMFVGLMAEDAKASLRADVAICLSYVDSTAGQRGRYRRTRQRGGTCRVKLAGDSDLQPTFAELILIALHNSF